MFGAYFAMTAYQFTGSFYAGYAVRRGRYCAARLDLRARLRRPSYGSDVLMQLLVCYAFVLIFDDVVRMIWGPEFKSMGMPAAFQVMPLFIAGGVCAAYYLLLIGVALAAAKMHSRARSDAHTDRQGDQGGRANPGMVSALRHKYRLDLWQCVSRSAACWPGWQARSRRPCAR